MSVKLYKDIKSLSFISEKHHSHDTIDISLVRCTKWAMLQSLLGLKRQDGDGSADPQARRSRGARRGLAMTLIASWIVLGSIAVLVAFEALDRGLE
jgi:hypothetical protein